MPVKQWLEERRIIQAEMQRLKDKLAISERTAKAESQMKEKLKVRLKTLEEGLKHSSISKAEKSNIISSPTASGGPKKRSTSQPRASAIGSPLFQQTNIKNNTNTVDGNLKQENPIKMKYTSAENMLKKRIWTSRSKVADGGEKENEIQVNTDMNLNQFNAESEAAEIKTIVDVNEDFQSKKPNYSCSDDLVSGFLYDRLQREVIKLRKSCETKDSRLQAKDEEIKMFMKKVDALTKSMEVECKKMKRDAAAREKEVSTILSSDDNRKNRNEDSSKRVMKKH